MITNLRSKLDRLATQPQQPKKQIKHDISRDIGGELVLKENGGYILRTVRYKVGEIYGDYTVENIEKAFELEEKLLFLDTETTGLGSVACPFLIGVAYFEGDVLVLEQYFMRDIDDEECVLKDVVEKYSGMTVVTYNGKSFDVPLIKARCTINGVDARAFASKQTDLLHLSRRIWKKRLVNCRLSTIEEEVLKLQRADDIPGSLIPEMYKRYLETGRSDEMLKAIEHNESDVVSMSVLLARLIRINNKPTAELDNPQDIMHLAEYYYGKKEYAKSKELLENVLKQDIDGMMQYNSMKYLSFIHKKHKNYDEAVALWEKMDRMSIGAVLPLVELAKYYEHTAKDIQKALDCTLRAKKNAQATGARDLIKEIDIRAARLRSKI